MNDQKKIATSGVLGTTLGSLLMILPALTPQAKALDPCSGNLLSRTL